MNTPPMAAGESGESSVLLRLARTDIAGAGRAGPRQRYLLAHRAVVRGAAAVVAVRARPAAPAPREVGLWSLVARLVPRLGEWAAYFSALSPRRDTVALGATRVPPREADDLLRAAAAFLDVVEHDIARDEGTPAHGPPADGSLRSADWQHRQRQQTRNG